MKSWGGIVGLLVLSLFLMAVGLFPAGLLVAVAAGVLTVRAIAEDISQPNPAGLRPVPAPQHPAASPKVFTSRVTRIATSKRSLPKAPGDAYWLPASASVRVKGHSIEGGFLYVGEGLRSVRGGSAEPALINPELPVGPRGDYRDGARMPYWPSYSEISPACRAGYLAWLAGGRCAPDAYIGYVFVYFYGLERRLLADAAKSEAAKAEIPALVGEIERLLGIYGGNGSFHSYATSLLECVRYREVPGRLYEQPAPPAANTWLQPLPVRIALSQLAADGKPMPADWALCWVMADEQYYARTPAERCREELLELFRLRYAETFGEGIRLRLTTTPLTVQHHPASSSLGDIVTKVPGLMETRIDAATVSRLRAMAMQASDSLDAYSRWKGRNADVDAVRGIGLLPSELVATRRATALVGFDAFLTKQAEETGSTIVPTGDLLNAWDSTVLRPIRKQEAALLAELLEKLGYGIDPDARYGKWSETATSAVFRLDGNTLAAPTPLYGATETVVRLAAAVASADGHASDTEIEHIEDHLVGVANLSVNDRRRLSARYHRLLAEGQGLKGIRKADFEAFDEVDRRALAHFLLALAAKDRTISPAEITVLTKVYGLLGLNSDELYSGIHDATAGGPGGATGPVTVRPASPGKGGFAIPRPAAKPSGFALNPGILQSLTQDTARVSGLLARIAAETEESQIEPAVEPEVTTDSRLDAPHRALLAHLASRDTISIDDFQSLAASLGLMANGAIETINDAAMDLTESPLFEEDGGDILIQGNIYREMLT